MTLISKPIHDPKLTRWWWRTLREWIYELVDPLWAAFRGENGDEIALINVTDINDVSASELAILDGLTATSDELNNLAGLTAAAEELNKADRIQSDGIAEGSKNVVLDTNMDVLGKRYDINQSLLTAIASGSHMWFDGSDDYVSVSADSNFDWSNVRAVTAVFKIPSSEGTYHLLGPCGTYANSAKGWAVANPDGTALVLRLMDPGQDSFTDVVGAASTNDGKWHQVDFVVENEGTITPYFDGIAGTPSEDLSDYDCNNNNALYIGRRNGDTYAMQGSIALIRIWNRALTADEIKAFASGNPVSFADTGASQADKVSNGEDWTGASGTTPPNNWSDTGAGTATYIIRDNSSIANFGDDKALELSACSGSKTLYQSIAQANKRYRLSFVYRNLDGSSSSYVALGSESNKVTLQNTGISGDGVVFEQELMADETDLMFFVDSGGTLQIDHVKVVQIGCAAAYLPEGITHAQWQDTSGNELHGAVNSAIPLSLPCNHSARYIQTGITDDTTLSNAIPGGYRIKSIAADVTGASSGMILNVGTTSGGSDVVNGEDISSNELLDLSVAKSIFSLSNAQSLYVNDDGGTAWSGVCIDLYIAYERIQ